MVDKFKWLPLMKGYTLIILVSLATISLSRNQRLVECFYFSGFGINPPSQYCSHISSKGDAQRSLHSLWNSTRCLGVTGSWSNVFLCCQTTSMQHLTSALPNLFQQHIPPLTWLLSGEKKPHSKLYVFVWWFFADLLFWADSLVNWKSRFVWVCRSLF